MDHPSYSRFGAGERQVLQCSEKDLLNAAHPKSGNSLSNLFL